MARTLFFVTRKIQIWVVAILYRKKGDIVWDINPANTLHKFKDARLLETVSNLLPSRIRMRERARRRPTPYTRLQSDADPLDSSRARRERHGAHPGHLGRGHGREDCLPSEYL